MTKVLLLCCFTINIWALSDRALFSINDKVLFVSEVNKHLAMLKVTRCYFDHKLLMTDFLNFSKENIVIATKSAEYSLLEIKDIERAATLMQLLTVSSMLLKVDYNLKQIKKCHTGDSHLLKIMIRTETYLRDKIISSKQTPTQIKNSLELFKRSFVDKVEYRTYY